MALNVALNGFGQLGRLVFLQLLNDKNVTITAINDTVGPELLAYRLKYDTMTGKVPFADSIKAGPGFISVKGRDIRVLEEKDPAKLPWKKLKTELVLECGGLSLKHAAVHIEAGAKRALSSGPAEDEPPVIVFGINENTLGPRDKVITAGSPVLGGLALIAKALHETAPIRSGFFTAIQADAGEIWDESRQVPAETGEPERNGFRRFRSAGIVPTIAGAAALGLVIPDLRGKLSGAVLRTPVAGGSSIILTAVVQAAGPLDAETINRAMKAKSNKVLGYNDEEIVSSDAAGTEYGAIFDATQTLVLPAGGTEENLYQVQAAAWYDKKSSGASQIVRIVKYLAGGGSAARNAGAEGNPPKKAAKTDDILSRRKPLINYQK
ncbi:MAG: type I glyceraldehyde-3-phosphate dehydrogenase [Treponema sp.]|jgi:glyceraldehyde 3-phosphate dehydrogenase|nr:type I glyceraldehyde-3-phosphate dehydrogenase [Treponema sp.]